MSTSTTGSKAETEEASEMVKLPDNFNDHFLCIGCEEYLRVPVWVCKKGHNRDVIQ